MMRIATLIVLIAASLFGTQIWGGFASPSTAPAFLWSPHHNDGIMESTNYQTISPKGLAKSLLSEGGWSNLPCSGKKHKQSVDLALIFVGKQASFTKSIFSMAFPYIDSSDEETTESSLLSGFRETCGSDFRTNNVAFLVSCSVEGENFKKLSDMHSVNSHLLSIMQKRPEGQADLVVFCSGDSLAKEFDQSRLTIRERGFIRAYQCCGAIWGKL